jgi:prepilin-type processing-associated H-X9-DG protein
MIAIGDCPLLDIGVPITDDYGHAWSFWGFAELSEAVYSWGVGYELGMTMPPWQNANAVRSATWMRKRHAGRWNIVFCDGHLESFRSTKDLFNYRSDDLLRRWNRDHVPHRQYLSNLP